MIPLPFTSPLLNPYRNMRDRTLRGENLFIAEGDLVVERLLDSPFPVESVMVVDRAVQRVRTMLEKKVPQNVPIYLVKFTEVESLVGFPFHQGILALGNRSTPWSLQDFLSPKDFYSPLEVISHPEVKTSPEIYPPHNLSIPHNLIPPPDILTPSVLPAPQETIPNSDLSGDLKNKEDLRSKEEPKISRKCIIVLPDITKPDNLGNVFRCGAALGADGILLGSQACDPLSRRAMRVSMGGVMQLPWIKSQDLIKDLHFLKSSYGYQIYATVVSENAIPLPEICWGPKIILCFGNEYDGLKPELLAECDFHITIPMSREVDSLNLGVSAGIFLYSALRT
ncbi:MAG: RNA methyltransferase [Planctomycetia bacterium]|nr:RNA methyltransferase [Planctomycetia bacterium]